MPPTPSTPSAPSTPPAGAAGSWNLGDRVVNRMGLGTMRLTVDPDPARALAVLRRAVELGVDHLDTAAFYVTPGGPIGGGTGERRYATELIRRAVAPYPVGVTIATKVGPGLDAAGEFAGEATTPAQLRRQVEENLRRLGVDVLDVVYLRIIRRSGRDSIAERFGALADLRGEGLIRHLGLSNVRVEHLDEAAAIGPVVAVQNRYSVDHRRDDDVLAACRDRGIAFVPFFAIAGDRREDGAGATEADARVTAVAAAHGATTHQVRIAWTLAQGQHVLAIPGTGDVGHLESNVDAAALRLSPDDLSTLATAED